MVEAGQNWLALVYNGVDYVKLVSAGFWFLAFSCTNYSGRPRRLSHLPVDPPELAKVDFGEILYCNVRKVPGGEEVRSSQSNNHQTRRQVA